MYSPTNIHSCLPPYVVFNCKIHSVIHWGTYAVSKCKMHLVIHLGTYKIFSRRIYLVFHGVCGGRGSEPWGAAWQYMMC